jgi:hypothetical protein
MKDETRQAFENVLDQYAASEQAAADTKLKQKTDRENIENEFEGVRTSIIVPTFNSIASLLTQRGWECVIGGAASAPKMEIYKGEEMRGVGGSATRPMIQFKLDQTTPSVSVFLTSQTQGGAEGQLYQPTDITADIVSELALKLFQRIVSEGIPQERKIGAFR